MKYNCKLGNVDALRFTRNTSVKEVENFLYGINFNITTERHPEGKRIIKFEAFTDANQDSPTAVKVEEGCALIKLPGNIYMTLSIEVFDMIYDVSTNQDFVPYTVDMTGIKKLIVYKGEDAKEEFEYMNRIHEQLNGNEDYINSNICLNRSCDRRDGTNYTVHCLVLESSKSNPKITI